MHKKFRIKMVSAVGKGFQEWIYQHRGECLFPGSRVVLKNLRPTTRCIFVTAPIMDDYSRYIISWELCKNMESADAMRSIEDALQKTGLQESNRPRLLSDNGSCYISKEFNTFISDKEMGHVRRAPCHPQSQGKIVRYHRSMKNVVKLENYFYPDDLRAKLESFVNYYNNERYHESLKNVSPADVYFGREKEILHQRKNVKIETIKERRKANQELEISA